MESACVEAAVNSSDSSGREVQAVVQKVPDSGMTHRDVSVTIFNFIYDPFRKMTGRDYTEIIHLLMPRTYGKRDYRIDVIPSVEIEFSLFICIISLIT